MTTIISGSISIEIEPQKITLKNYAEFAAWRDKLKAHTENGLAPEGLVAILQKAPELAEMVTVTGSFREDYITKRAKDFDKSEDPRALAMEEAQKRLISIATDSPDVAKALFFPDIKYKQSVEAIVAAIDVIKATANVSLLNKKQKDLIESEITSEFWQGVEFEGVAAYAENFCKYVK